MVYGTVLRLRLVQVLALCLFWDNISSNIGSIAVLVAAIVYAVVYLVIYCCTLFVASDIRIR